MKKRKTGLQKFTETDAKIKKALSLEQITHKDLEDFSEKESDSLMELLTEKFNELKGAERDRFYQKIEPITGEGTKNQIWESNHNQITWAISALMQEYGRMPTNTEIAIKTELSRQTVHKHIKEYKTHSLFLETREQFEFLSSKVLSKVFTFAVNGDMRAAKLYFDMVGGAGKTSNSTSIQNQNNYIQINGTVLNQETIKKLKPEQLNLIEEILKSSQVSVIAPL
jgi:hypothetical protein